MGGSGLELCWWKRLHNRVRVPHLGVLIVRIPTIYGTILGSITESLMSGQVWGLITDTETMDDSHLHKGRVLAAIPQKQRNFNWQSF